jgi:hypothetical protein
MLQSEATDKLVAALVGAHKDIGPAKFNAENTFFKKDGKPTRYANLVAVLEAGKPITGHGLAMTQTMEARGGFFVLVTTLRHTSGQWIASEYPLPQVAKPQELASAITYARRYSISCILCIAADEDDDANAAQQGGQVAQMPKRENPHTTKPEDTGDYTHRVDPATGEVVDCIPVHMHRVAKLMPSKPETRAVAEDLLKRMREHKTAASLVEFADDTAEEWAALPDKWLGHYQAEYQMLLDSLRKQKAA